MRVLSLDLENFGSYKKLNFDYQNKGLVLISGATGSGKSTLQEGLPWTLYGKTSKNGGVSEVCSWTTNNPTTGEVTFLDQSNNTITVVRVRGNSQQNDLYWFINNGNKIRGKDLSDSQKLLNDIIGLTYEQYVTSACFNEFSETGKFFSANAKQKRQVFENIVSMQLPMTLAENTSILKKRHKKELAEISALYSREQGKHDQLQLQIISTTKSKLLWDTRQETKLVELKQKHAQFDKDKQRLIDSLQVKFYQFESTQHAQVKELENRISRLEHMLSKITEESKHKSKKCPTCGHIDSVDPSQQQFRDETHSKLITLNTQLVSLRSKTNQYQDQIKQTNSKTNHYQEMIDIAVTEENPFIEQITQQSNQVLECQQAVIGLETQVNRLKSSLSSLDQLYDLSLALRSRLLEDAISNAQRQINEYISDYFDAEFNVMFTPTPDGLDTVISKNGYDCVYTQLSKGQRQILKLCFALTIMNASSNNQGIDFNVVSFDEALDGLDTNLKVKAFGLFEKLSQRYETVLMIEHAAEFQNLFTNKYTINLIGDESVISYE